MGTFISKTKPGTSSGEREYTPTRRLDDSGAEQNSGAIDQVRITELMQALQHIAKLQRAATSARIEGRQKRREAANRRQDVWIRDANFMTEIQRLGAEGKFTGLERLLNLASQCQTTRDGLGQLEQEAIDTEQQWEGQIWKLREAENELYARFENEFIVAESYPPAPPSVQSSQFASSSEEGEEASQIAMAHQIAVSATSSASHTFNIPEASSPSNLPVVAARDIMLLGLEKCQDRGRAMSTSAAYSYSDSGVGDIDGLVSQSPISGTKNFSQQLPQRDYPAIEIFPQLLIDFASRRDRINKWLEDIVLDSHLESTSLFTALRTRLALENKETPSNWSQLVIAFWELDGAAIPRLNKTFDKFSLDEAVSIPSSP